ncbi:hypothetical protein AMS68_000903 [Peltaster fructicola]|uniref:Superoxide dismutase 1 copper chaperone n=1 Tax=Peltaster fructicola TaxID=286661 RepID=A0A6H0XKZ4_9PEZI|nr:hypothetical protein AMS68_000903 [Peltaster fructicola]
MIPAFQTTFAVPLSCNACVEDVSSALKQLDGIQKIDADVAKQLIAVTGTAAPSAIVEAIQGTGRDAILRGSGKSDNSAAVCILETHASNVENPVRGLVRMVQVAPKMTIMDMTLKGVSTGTYEVNIRESGDISDGPRSTGSIWDLLLAKKENRQAKGILGTISVSKSGLGSAFIDKPIEVWEMIGRSVVVSREGKPVDKEDQDALVGVIARSAGVWDNDKTVCSCSGKTVWEERAEQKDRGML